MYKRFLNWPIIFFISLMIYKKYLSFINVIRSEGLPGLFFYIKTSGFRGYKYLLNYPSKEFITFFTLKGLCILKH